MNTKNENIQYHKSKKLQNGFKQKKDTLNYSPFNSKISDNFDKSASNSFIKKNYTPALTPKKTGGNLKDQINISYFSRNRIGDMYPGGKNQKKKYKTINNNKNIFTKRKFNHYNTEENDSLSEEKNMTINGYFYYPDSSEIKKLMNLNNDLIKKNKQLKKKEKKMNYRIKELLEEQNIIKMLKMENQESHKEKERRIIYEMQLKNDFYNYKKKSLIELERKSNIIIKLKEEIMRMKILLDEKTENNKYNNGQLLMKINGLNNQINNLKLQKKNIILEKQKNELILNQKVDNLIQKNKTYIKIIEDLKKEKQEWNNIPIQMQNKIKETNEKLISLENENNSLKKNR